MSRYVKGYCLAILAILLLAACQTAKKPVRKQIVIKDPKHYGIVTVDTIPYAKDKSSIAVRPVPDATVTPKPAVDKALLDNLSALAKKQLPFQTFSGKAKMHFKGPGQNYEFAANIRIKKDEIIWIYINALGGIVPVARVYITPDSFQMINYLQKEAYKKHISEANKLLPAKVDFQILQNLLVGNVLNPSGKPINAQQQGNISLLQLESSDLLQDVAFNKADNTIATIRMRSRDGQTDGTIQYNAYASKPIGRFSEARVVNLSNDGQAYYLSMDFDNEEFNKQLDFSFSIPKSYTLK